MGDHELVALLEDVEGHQLSGEQHRRELEDRQLDRVLWHLDGWYARWLRAVHPDRVTMAREWEPISKPRGSSTGSRARRGIRAVSCSPSWRAMGFRSTSFAPPSRRTAWRCSRSSGFSRVRASG